MVRRPPPEVRGAAFFTAFGGTVELSEFTPIAFAANNNEVRTLVRMRTTYCHRLRVF